MDSDTLKEIGEVIGAGVATALIILAKPIKDYFALKSKIIFAKDKIESQKKVQDIIDEIRIKLRVDRCEIYEYSNGEKTLNGLPFLFGTMTFESIYPHLASTKKGMVKFPTSWFASLLDPLLDIKVKSVLWNDHGTCVADRKSTITDETGGRLLKGHDMQNTLMIKFSNNISDGVLSISTHNKDIVLSDEDYYELISDVEKIFYHLRIKH